MLSPEQVHLASNAVRELRVALSNFFLYSAENAMVRQSLDRFLADLEKLFATLPSVSLGESEGRLVVEGTPLDERSTGSLNMVKDLFLVHRIHSLAFLKGLKADELRVLFGRLKPKALPPGTGLAKALAGEDLPHLKLNEKVFVAIKEGEKVVAEGAAPGALGGEENLQEALEALQYFLQIFARVRPEANKKEVGQKLMEHLGGWLRDESFLAPQASPRAVADWRSLLGGFLSLKKDLAAAREPRRAQQSEAGLDELLRKLVRLGEAQGLGPGPAEGPDGEEQGSLFEVDPLFDGLRSGSAAPLADPDLEGPAGAALGRLQSPGYAEAFRTAWQGLWQNVFSGEGQALALRHLNRLQWDRLPRDLQLEGFRNLRHFLAGDPDPLGYFVALSLGQNWMPLELSRPAWGEVVSMTETLGILAKRHPPLFERQDEAARATLSAIFYPPALESLYRAPAEPGEESDLRIRLFSTLSSLTAPFLMEKVRRHPAGSPEWGEAVDLLHQMESAGIPVYERWISRHDSPEEWAVFLGMFERVNFSARLADHLEKSWNGLTVETRLKVFQLAGRWKRTDFHPLALEALHGFSPELVLAALRLLPKLGMEGDSRVILAELKRHVPDAPGRETFWVGACRALGEMAEPYALSDLMEWADKYKFLESKRERGPAVRLAALEALGHFRSERVEAFLAKLEPEEKEMKPTVQEALRRVRENLRKGPSAAPAPEGLGSAG